MKQSFLFRYGYLLFVMSKNELKSRYSGNNGGVLWAFVQPSITIAIFWFVFSVGFKSAPINNVPFILWLVAGMVPWFFISEAWGLATNSVLESSFLVKKIVFEVSLLPLVKIVSALFIHLFFLLLMVAMYLWHGYSPSFYWFQLGYYLLASIVLVVGLSLLSSSIVVFFRDLGQIVTMGIQFWFWLTPIFWTLPLLPEKYQWFFKFNPIYYITQGYRDCFIDHVWFWEKPVETLFFWTVSIFLLGMGTVVFHRLRPHFADVM